MTTPQTPADRAEAARQVALNAGAHRAFDRLQAARRTGDKEMIRAARLDFVKSMCGVREKVCADIDTGEAGPMGG